LADAQAARAQRGGHIDLAVLLTLDEEERLRRLGGREGAERTARWLATWRPAEDRYFDHDRTPEGFDLVLAADGTR
jgi:hypothetical protein